MGKKKRAETTIDEQTDNEQTDELDEETQHVNKQIQQLEELLAEIKQECEREKQRASSTTFGELKIVNKVGSQNNTIKHAKIRNVDAILQQELHKLSGFWCAKVENDEHIFNFSSSSNYTKPYAVQLFRRDKKPKLKTWVLPWGLDVSFILKETPLQELTDTVPFLKNFKRHVDCYTERQKQFDALKESLTAVNNIRVDATMGYTTIDCYLLRVYDKSADKKIDLTVNLRYGSSVARPNTVRVWWNLEKEPNDDVTIKMKSFTKAFRNLPLRQALDQIQSMNHPMFAWAPEESTDTLIEIQEDDLTDREASDGENNSPSPLPKKRKRSQVRIKKPPKPKTNVNEQPPDLTNENETPQPPEDDLQVQKKRKKVKKKVKEPQSPKKKENNDPKLSKKAPVQTELSFKGTLLTQTLKETFKKPTGRTKARQSNMTSTPMIAGLREKRKQPPLSSLEISPIVSDKSLTETTKAPEGKRGTKKTAK